MSKILALNGVAPSYYDLDGNATYTTQNSVGKVGVRGDYLRNTKSFSPPSNLSPGSTTTLDQFKLLAKDVKKIERLFIRAKLVNNHATNDITFFNPWDLVSKLSFAINSGKKVDFSGEELSVLYSEYLKKKEPTHQYHELQMIRSESGTTFGGETSTALGVVQKFVILDLFAIFPAIDGWISNNPDQRLMSIDIELTFKPNSGTTDNNRFVLCSSTNNVYASCVYNDIELVRYETTIVDTRLMRTPKSICYTIERIEKMFFDVQSWSTVGTDKRSLKLTDFPRRSNVIGISAYLFPTGAITAYNDTDSCKYYSGHNYIGWSVKQVGSNDILDFSTTSEVDELKRYTLMTNNFRNKGIDLPLEVVNNTTSLPLFFVRNATYINFQTVELFEGHDRVICGIDTRNTEQDYEINLTCVGSLNANCRLHVFMHYVEYTTIAQNGEWVRDIDTQLFKK